MLERVAEHHRTADEVPMRTPDVSGEVADQNATVAPITAVSDLAVGAAAGAAQPTRGNADQ